MAGWDKGKGGFGATPSVRDRKLAQANPVDRHVGDRIRRCRVMLGLSQKALADRIGVKFPQVQKYEDGINRISASRLFAVSRELGSAVSYFFEDMPPGIGDAAPGGLADEQTPFDASGAVNDELFNRAETLDLIRAFSSIGSPGIRRGVIALLTTLAEVVPRTAEEEDDSSQC